MCEENNQGAINKLLSQFTRKELLAWFIIIDLVILIIGISTWKFAFAKEVVDQIGFASSLASIIMAALAIIYAFFQTNASSEQNTLLQLHIQKIGEQINALSGISTEMAQLRSSFNERMQTIVALQDDYTKSKDLIQETKTAIDDISEKLGSEEKRDEIAQELILVSDKLEELSELNKDKIITDFITYAYNKDKEPAYEVINSYAFPLMVRPNFTIEDVMKEIRESVPLVSEIFIIERKKNNIPNHFYIKIVFSNPFPTHIIQSYIKSGAKTFQGT